MPIGNWVESAHEILETSFSKIINPTRKTHRPCSPRADLAIELLEERICLSASTGSLDEIHAVHKMWYVEDTTIPGFISCGDDHDHHEEHEEHDHHEEHAEECEVGETTHSHESTTDGSSDEFVASGSKWSQPGGLGSAITITYSYSNLLDGTIPLNELQLMAAIEEALGLWATYAPLHFVEVADSGPAPSDSSYNASNHPDIRIGHHYIDGGSGANVLAHAYYPQGNGISGDVHFDNSNTWSIGAGGGGIDVIEVMLHEVGHALGLNHEPNSGNNAIMNPYYGGRFNSLGSGYLLQDDINGIRAIYGTGVGSVTPLDEEGPRVTLVTPTGNIADVATSSITLTFSEAIKDGTFTTDDIVTLTGPSGAITVNSLTKVNNTTYRIDFDPQIEVGTYTLTIGPDILDSRDNKMDQDQDDTNGEATQDQFTTTFTLTAYPGPRVLSAAAIENATTGAVDRVRYTFSETLDESTFTTADIATLSGPGGSITPSAVNKISDTVYEVVFPNQTSVGTYTVIIGPNITDYGGNSMNQDNDGTNGEATEDQHTITFDIVAAPVAGQFDFGTASSPRQGGYSRIQHNTTDVGTLGFGWLSGSISPLDRGTANDLTRDSNYTKSGTFAYNVNAGIYDVTITVGDTGSVARNNMAISLEGTLVDTVSTTAGSVATNTYTVLVSDGQLTVGLGDGSNWTLIESMVVVEDTSGPQVSSSAEVANANTGAVDRVIINFDRDIQDGTFTTADIDTLSGPGGAITPSAVNKITGSQYEVVFPSQTTAGTYTLTIGPALTDTVGNEMNQDGDSTNGEATADQYTTTFTLLAPPVAGQFDFGLSTSPRAAGYTRVTNMTTDVAGLGYGWTSNVGGLARSTGTDLTKDANYTRNNTFSYDLANGRYLATVTVGDTDSTKAWSDMQIYLEGSLVDTVTSTLGNTVTNVYSVTVTDGQLNMRLASGSGSFVVVQALAVAVDTSGPSVTAANEVRDVNDDSVDRVILDFSYPLQDGTFTTADVATLSGPGGAITPSAVNKITNTQYEVVFPKQTAAGTYTLKIGPAITDIDGNGMNQDGDGNNGEATEDQYTTTFTLGTPVTAGQFDFGTPTSPRETGYTRITGTTTDVAGLGYGWSTNVGHLDRATGTDITRDGNYTKSNTFSYNLSNGRYDVTIITGDLGSAARHNMTISLEGVLVDTVSTSAGMVVSNTYSTTVLDGQLTVGLGNGTDWVVIESLVVVEDTTGPQVSSSTEVADLNTGAVDRVIVNFDRDIQDGTFTTADVATLSGPGGAITPSAVNKITSSQYEVVFPSQTAAGTYTLTIGPTLTDTVGNEMNQDGDGTNGEATADQYTTTFTLLAPPVAGQFDFGLSTSPRAAGYYHVTNTTTDIAGLGYGWVSNVGGIDRDTADDRTRDSNYTKSGTFAYTTSNGAYDVTITVGDTGTVPHDNMAIYLEGVLADTVSTTAGQVVTNVYNVTVADGQLTIGFGNGSDFALVESVAVASSPFIYLPPEGEQLVEEEPAELLFTSPDETTEAETFPASAPNFPTQLTELIGNRPAAEHAKSAQARAAAFAAWESPQARWQLRFDDSSNFFNSHVKFDFESIFSDHDQLDDLFKRGARR